jgi:hypothetical protein
MGLVSKFVMHSFCVASQLLREPTSGATSMVKARDDHQLGLGGVVDDGIGNFRRMTWRNSDPIVAKRCGVRLACAIASSTDLANSSPSPADRASYQDFASRISRRASGRITIFIRDRL